MTWVIDENELKQQMAAASDSMTFVKARKDETLVRVLPSTSDDNLLPYRDFAQHDSIHPMSGRFATALAWDSIRSNQLWLGITQEIGRLRDEDLEKYSEYGDPYDVARKFVSGLSAPEVQKLRVRRRSVFNVVDRTDGFDVFGIFEVSPTVRKGIVSLFRSPRYGAAKVLSPTDGMDILIMANGEEGMRRRYNSFIPQPGSKPVPEGWEASVQDLDRFVASRVQRYDDKAFGMFATVGRELTDLGFTKDMVGLDEDYQPPFMRKEA